MPVVFPTAYFGSIGYFQELARHASVLIDVHEHFPKQSYRNRFDLLGSEGIISLTVPVTKPEGTKTPTSRILVSDHEDWRSRHWRSVRTAYESAPFFDHYGPQVYELLYADHSSLIDLNMQITRQVLQWLDIPVTLALTSEFIPLSENDFRIVLCGKHSFQQPAHSPYIQVFPEIHSWRPSLSILDALFCEGPMARNLLIARQ